jgi:tetratricopeptide (TPR) repeat protein
MAKQPEIHAKVLVNLGFVHLELGELAAAEERVTQASRYELNQLELQAGLTNALGVICLERGQLRKARQRFIEALALASQANSQRIEASARGNLGEVALELGDYRQGVEALLATLRLCRQRVGPAEAPALTGLARAYRLTGEPTQAEESAGAALLMARDIGQRRYEVDALVELGHIACSQRRLLLAHERFGLARDLANHLGYQRAVAESHAGSAVAYLVGHAPANARLHADLGYAIARARELRLLEMRLLVVLARIANEQGDGVGAAAQARAAVAWHEQTGSSAGLADALVVLGTAEPADADRHWGSALGLYERIGSPLAAEVRSLLVSPPSRAQ